MAEQVEMHGWFSKEQQKSTGLLEYKTSNGATVEVTCVTKTKKHGMGFKDMQYRGLVAKYVRQLVKPVMKISRVEARDSSLRPGTSW
jgi:hypothetical protein